MSHAAQLRGCANHLDSPCTLIDHEARSSAAAQLEQTFLHVG
jgi:hypothetical protein